MCLKVDTCYNLNRSNIDTNFPSCKGDDVFLSDCELGEAVGVIMRVGSAFSVECTSQLLD